jgi:hypothetical protein
VKTRPGFFLLVRMKVMELPAVLIFPLFSRYDHQ